MTSRLRRLAAVAGVATMLAVAPCAPAFAEPGNPAMVSLDELGASNTIWFDARQDTTSSSFSFEVPKGLTPSSLNATLELPVTMQSGYLTVAQSGRTVHRMPLPLQDGAAMVIPLTGIEVFDGWANITLTITALPGYDRFCWHPDSPIRLVNSSVTFSGTAAPLSTVAGFLPRSLAKLTIGIPLKPSPAESEAAVQLSAAMAKRYGWQKADIVVVPITGGADTLPPPGPRERQIWLKEGKDPGLELLRRPGTPALLISGPGDELTNQTRLLSDPALDFALSTKAVADDLTPEPQPLLSSATLEQLKQRVNDSESLRPGVEVKIDQTVFGQSLAGVRVHLLGSYTPLPGDFNGEFTAEIGNEVIDRWPADAQGTIDRSIDIPNQLLGRITMLKIKEQTTGNPGHCNDFLNMRLRIDPETEITANRAGPPVPPGFRSLPQAMGPTIEFGIQPGSAADTVRAAKIAVGLQRNSSVPLITTVTSLSDAIASGQSAVLVSPNGWTDDSIALPFSAEAGRITIQGLDPGGNPAKLTLEPPIKFGSLQTIYDGKRSLLVATSNGAPAQLDELLRWLGEEPSRWSDLDGRAVISVPFNAPITVPNRRSDLAAAQATAKSSLAGWPWLVASGIAAAAVVGAVLILLRSRKPRVVAAADESIGERPEPADDDHADHTRPADDDGTPRS